MKSGSLGDHCPLILLAIQKRVPCGEFAVRLDGFPIMALGTMPIKALGLKAAMPATEALFVLGQFLKVLVQADERFFLCTFIFHKALGFEF